jgi:hypothetical protein
MDQFHLFNHKYLQKSNFVEALPSNHLQMTIGTGPRDY